MDGQAGALVKPSDVTVLNMCEAWSGESRFLPSQQLDDVRKYGRWGSRGLEGEEVGIHTAGSGA